LVPLVPLFLVAGCVVPQSRYDRLATEYHAENQARRQLEDEVQRRDGEMTDLKSALQTKKDEYSALEQDAAQSKEQLAKLQKELEEAKKGLTANGIGEGVEILPGPDNSLTYRVADQLLFDSGSTDIRENGKKALLQIAKQIMDKHYQNIRIDGHTDSDPVVHTKSKFPLGNYELSLERALAVFGVLTKDGKVPENLFTIAGFGPSRPVAKGDASDAAKAKNRRVEIHVAVPKS
jgi:chemotaxis protein MotB